jgi:hypothetical protein
MNPARFAIFAVVTVSLGTLAMGIQQPPVNRSETGLRFAAGPPDGPALARTMAAAKLSRRESPDTWNVLPPLTLYALESDNLAAGKGLETTRACGFQYLIESARRNYVGTAEVQVNPDCAGEVSALGTGTFGYETFNALEKLVAEDQVKKDSYEPRLIYAKLKPALPSSRPTLVALWLKSSQKHDDLIYPLEPGSLNIGGNQLYQADDFFRRLRPALANVEWNSDYALHDYFTNRFLESRGNGPNRMGDDPMQLHDSMRLRITSVPTETLKLEVVNLIGVAMHERPEAFMVSNHRSLGLQIRSRPPTPFEERALLELTSGENVAAHTDATGRFVVGALRAKAECVQCHRAYKTGDLLGALSYRLIPATRLNSTVAVNIR